MNKNNYSLEILVNGRPAQEYHKTGKSFVESRESTEYTLRFRNNGWKRVLAVFSVDGIEVLKGKVAAQADNGYIVDPFSSIEIKGYRIDEATVAAFKFADSSRSYSVQVGAERVNKATGEITHDKTDKNNGVIGVRVFEEDVADKNYSLFKETIYPSVTYGGVLRGGNVSTSHLAASGGTSVTGSISFTCGGNVGTSLIANGISQAFNSINIPSRQYNTAGVLVSTSACSASVSPDFDMGTTWGTKTIDKVREVSFKKIATSTDIEIYYASRTSLEQYGIDFTRTKQIVAWPSAFEDKRQFCQKPDWYKA